MVLLKEKRNGTKNESAKLCEQRRVTLCLVVKPQRGVIINNNCLSFTAGMIVCRSIVSRDTCSLIRFH